MVRDRTSGWSKPAPLIDAVVVAVAFGFSILVVLHGRSFVSRPTSHDLDALTIVLVACSTLPLFWWRRSPFGVFALTATANVALAAFAYPIGVPAGPAVALFLLASHRDESRVPIERIFGAAVLFLLAYVAAAAWKERTIPGFELVHASLLWAVAWFAGERVRLRHEQIADLKRQAQRERQLAGAEERARIARDLHDSAGHAINVIAVRAGAARLRYRDDPERALGALEAIENVARQTAADIDRIVGALRDHETDDVVEPPVGLASLGGLIDQHADAGLDITYVTSGCTRPVDRPVDQAAYRILQEALTNASRHGAGTAHVETDYGPTMLELRITNPVDKQRSESTTGHGLVGMQERAAALGGDVEIDGTNGAFTIRARLPYGATRR
jgi:signal transduction histidine kinase